MKDAINIMTLNKNPKPCFTHNFTFLRYTVEESVDNTILFSSTINIDFASQDTVMAATSLTKTP